MYKVKDINDKFKSMSEQEKGRYLDSLQKHNNTIDDSIYKLVNIIAETHDKESKKHYDKELYKIHSNESNEFMMNNKYIYISKCNKMDVEDSKIANSNYTLCRYIENEIMVTNPELYKSANRYEDRVAMDKKIWILKNDLISKDKDLELLIKKMKDKMNIDEDLTKFLCTKKDEGIQKGRFDKRRSQFYSPDDTDTKFPLNC